MNFFDVALVEEDDALYADGVTFRLRVPEAKAKALGPYKGQKVVLGIRPEDIHDPEFAPPNITEGRIKAKVEVTELMGNEVFLYLLTGDKTFIARVDPRTRAGIGHEVEAVANMDNIHLFDPQTEEAIR
jgi:multiple sugar transport system ATP-binding protein